MTSTRLLARYGLGYAALLTAALVGIGLRTTVPLGNLALGVSIVAAVPALFVLGGFNRSVEAAEDSYRAGVSPSRALDVVDDTQVTDFPRVALAALVLGGTAVQMWALTFAGVV